MSATLPKSPDALMTVRERHLKVPIVLAIAAAMLALLLLALPRDGVTTFDFGGASSARVEVPTAVTSWILVAVMVVLT
ncbi:MAG: ABC transporter permease, partial [Microbacterium sp.]